MKDTNLATKKDTYLSAKQFADLCKTTKRTILYYDQIDLLTPDSRENGNRKYTSQQVLAFEKINLLQSLGLSLEDIRQSFVSHETFTEIFLRHRDDMLEKQKEIVRQVTKINEFLANLEKNARLVTPEIKQIPAYSYYGLEKVGSYKDIGKYSEELANRVYDKDYRGTYFTFFKKYTYAPVSSKIIIGVILAKKSKEVSLPEVVMPAHTVVSYTYKGSYANLGYIWDQLWNYVAKEKIDLNPLFSPREIYLEGPSKEKNKGLYITQLQIPIQQK